MMNDTKECLFETYCKTCKHFEKEDWVDPCNDCLSEPYNIDSYRPVKYEEDERRVKNAEKRK